VRNANLLIGIVDITAQWAKHNTVMKSSSFPPNPTSQYKPALNDSWKLRRASRQSEGEWYSRGYLPHRNKDALIQHVTVHLADSLPKTAVEKLKLSIIILPEEQRRNELRRKLHDLMDAGHGSCLLKAPAVAESVQDSLQHFHGVRYYLHAWVVMPNHFHVLFETIEGWPMAKIVSSWKKFTSRQIRDYVRMISRVADESRANQEIGVPHRENTPEETTTFTDLKTAAPPRDATSEKNPAHNRQPYELSVEMEKILKNPVWHREFWDRYIRDEEHYYDTIEYIHNNPVKARLVNKPEDWKWSSVGWGGYECIE